MDINVLLLVSALPAGSFSVCVDSATRPGEWEKPLHGVGLITLNKTTSIIFNNMHGLEFITQENRRKKKEKTSSESSTL
jgi:hypothetical protein